MSTSLSQHDIEQIIHPLNAAHKEFLQTYGGDRPRRQPVHTLYGGAQLFKAETTQKIGELALKSFREYAPDAQTLARAVNMSGDRALWTTVHDRVTQKLKSSAIEDFRIDFEDGYGIRPDKEEDETASFAASEVARGMRENLLPPFIGIRVKSLSPELKLRSLRTLDIFVSQLIKQSQGRLPDNFVVTLPKVCMPSQVTVFVKALDLLEKKLGLTPKSLELEIMIEQTQAIVDSDGHIALPRILAAADGRCRGAHFGTYDYTASCDITASQQKMNHPACQLALLLMKNAYAGTGVWLSDGATSIMPIPPHRAAGEQGLSAKQIDDNQQAVHRAWKISYDHIMLSLQNAYYQGWDLHPAQIPVRYAATYAFFLESLSEASMRLKNFIAKAAQATLVGDIFDDAATGQGLLNYFLRALDCGAIAEKEIDVTGLTAQEVRTKSFVTIVKNRTP